VTDCSVFLQLESYLQRVADASKCCEAAPLIGRE
jgi:hypothetical protein